MSENHGIVEWISCTSPLDAICETFTKAALAATPASMRFAAFLSEIVVATAAEAPPEKAGAPTIADVWARILGLPPVTVETMFKECVELASTHPTPAVAGAGRRDSSSGCCCGASDLSYSSASPVPPAQAVLQCLTAITGSFEELDAFKRRFGSSLATSAAVCYCLGIGDRHLGNCLLDLKTGEVRRGWLGNKM